MEQRFKLEKDTEWWFVSDNTIKVNEFGYRDDLTGEDKYRGLQQDLTEQEVVDMLNELNNENKELQYQLRNCEDARESYKQDWKACSSYCDEYKGEIISLKDNVEGLMEENKELKSLCKVLITHIEKNSIAFVIDEDVRRLLE